MFPYYIVRFKHIFLSLNTLSILVFPYYIVRFKPIGRFQQDTQEACFHTT